MAIKNSRQTPANELPCWAIGVMAERSLDGCFFNGRNKSIHYTSTEQDSVRRCNHNFTSISFHASLVYTQRRCTAETGCSRYMQAAMWNNTMEGIEINWVWPEVHQSYLKNSRRFLKNCLSSRPTPGEVFVIMLCFDQRTHGYNKRSVDKSSGSLSNPLREAWSTLCIHRRVHCSQDHWISLSPFQARPCRAVVIMGEPRVMSSCTLFPERTIISLIDNGRKEEWSAAAATSSIAL